MGIMGSGSQDQCAARMMGENRNMGITRGSWSIIDSEDLSVLQDHRGSGVHGFIGDHRIMG